MKNTELNMERYAELERIHLGDFEKKTGIYHPEVQAMLNERGGTSMNYLDEKELITHCIKCDTALEESESMTCTACNKETEYERHVEEEALCMFCNQKEDLIQVLYNGSVRHTHKECAEVNDDYELETIETYKEDYNMMTCTCEVCEKEFNTRMSEFEPRFCSDECQSKMCKCCYEVKPDVVLGLCDACDSKYGE